MVTIRFSESEQIKFFNMLDIELIKKIKEFSNVEFGYIIEDGKIVGIEKEM